MRGFRGCGGTCNANGNQGRAATGKPGLRTCYTNGYDVPFRVIAYTTWDDPTRNLAPGAKTCFDVEFVSAPETEQNRVAIFGEVVPNLGNVLTWIFPDRPGGSAYTVYTCWTASCKNTDPYSESVMAVGDVRSITYRSAIIDLTRGPDVQGMISLDLEIRPR